MFHSSPDFEGIKTATFRKLFHEGCFIPALISKGLRHIPCEFWESDFCFIPALISKGLRRTPLAVDEVAFSVAIQP